MQPLATDHVKEEKATACPTPDKEKRVRVFYKGMVWTGPELRRDVDACMRQLLGTKRRSSDLLASEELLDDERGVDARRLGPKVPCVGPKKKLAFG